ncbi:helix-turn-helix domain-containing protein [Halosolutus gelatinilyticus]|uniref:helix-turn-helix domain-containing protein n=1 Tax=Halosolutus gelatinilyticus TaxID=2931975 RepID=UPI001FF673B8|nr:helix-turn-helix domain-containing protein [Halosolutus gelatinilyticus]
MPSIRLKIQATAVEDWLADFSIEFPDAEFRVLTDQPTEDGLLGVAEVVTTDGNALVRQLEEAPEVRSEVLYISEQRVLIQALAPMTESYEALRRSGTLPEYPAILQDGWFSFTVTTSQEQLSEYIDELAAAGVPYQILSLTQSHESSTLLTDRQWQFISDAIERGYYDIPRGCTLVELAESFNINKSSAGRLLRRAESRIIKQFVAEAAG